MKSKTLIVIGGGAAGFFCAVNAAFDSNLNVIIVEKTNKLLTKVKVSGGGRCNVTHACFSISEMVKNYPRGENFLKQSFHQFFTKDTIDWFEKRNVPLKKETDGRMFPLSNSSQSIIDCLLHEANKNSVQIIMNREVEEIKKNENESFGLYFKDGSIMQANFICIACGGYPKKDQYLWLSHIGHTFENPAPSLFTFNILNNPIAELMGISVQNVQIKINKTAFFQKGPLLITHWGFSGPVILKLSAFAARQLASMQYIFSISVNWLSEYNETSLLEKLKKIRIEDASKKIINRNPFLLPQRFWEYQMNRCEIDKDLRWADLSSKQQNKLVKQLCTEQFEIKSKTTFKEEFVTAGGIKLSEINATTMQSKIVPNIFFAGEVLDVDGITGGFNFQHAWTSGYLAAQEIKLKNC